MLRIKKEHLNKRIISTRDEIILTNGLSQKQLKHISVTINADCVEEFNSIPRSVNVTKDLVVDNKVNKLKKTNNDKNK